MAAAAATPIAIEAFRVTLDLRSGQYDNLDNQADTSRRVNE